MAQSRSGDDTLWPPSAGRMHVKLYVKAVLGWFIHKCTLHARAPTPTSLPHAHRTLLRRMCSSFTQPRPGPQKHSLIIIFNNFTYCIIIIATHGERVRSAADYFRLRASFWSQMDTSRGTKTPYIDTAALISQEELASFANNFQKITKIYKMNGNNKIKHYYFYNNYYLVYKPERMIVTLL